MLPQPATQVWHALDRVEVVVPPPASAAKDTHEPVETCWQTCRALCCCIRSWATESQLVGTPMGQSSVPLQRHSRSYADPPPGRKPQFGNAVESRVAPGHALVPKQSMTPVVGSVPQLVPPVAAAASAPAAASSLDVVAVPASEPVLMATHPAQASDARIERMRTQFPAAVAMDEKGFVRLMPHESLTQGRRAKFST